MEVGLTGVGRTQEIYVRANPRAVSTNGFLDDDDAEVLGMISRVAKRYRDIRGNASPDSLG